MSKKRAQWAILKTEVEHLLRWAQAANEYSYETGVLIDDVVSLKNPATLSAKHFNALRTASKELVKIEEATRAIHKTLKKVRL